MRWKSSGTGSSTTSLSALTESTWEQRSGGKTEHSASASSNIHRTGNCSFKTHRKRSKRVQALTGLCKDRESDRQDLVRFSPVPWIAFTEMKHASSFRTGDSATRISTGKLIEQNGHWMLPISVTAHHGLMDGRHVSILLDRIADKD